MEYGTRWDGIWDGILNGIRYISEQGPLLMNGISRSRGGLWLFLNAIGQYSTTTFIGFVLYWFQVLIIGHGTWDMGHGTLYCDSMSHCCPCLSFTPIRTSGNVPSRRLPLNNNKEYIMYYKVGAAISSFAFQHQPDSSPACISGF